MNRTEALCRALGWQGGTIHQVSQETGCSVAALLYGKPASQHLNSSYAKGWFSGSSCSLAHNIAFNFPKFKGNLDYWIGVALGIRNDHKD